MKKVDLKKLALMGITGGVMIASQGLNAEQATANLSLSGNYQQGCGGGGGKCGSPRYEDDSDDGDQGSDSDNKGSQGNKRTPSGYNYRSSNRAIAMNDDVNGAVESEENAAANKKFDRDAMQKNGGRPMAFPRSGNMPNGNMPNGNMPKGSPVQPGDNQVKPVNGAPNGQTTYNRGRPQQNRMIGMNEDSNMHGGQSCASTSGCASKNYQPENEEQFVKQLDSEGKQMYNTLSPEGKKLAQRLAKQYSDKNQAVKHAARQMSGANPSDKMDNGSKRQGMHQ